jgi:hypothetical protein
VIMIARHRCVACVAGLALLLAANALVAAMHLGSHAGQTYRWISQESGSQLTYTPSVFGSARITPGRVGSSGRAHWVLVEPHQPSALLPWNWLALLLLAPSPDPDAIIRQEGLEAG